MSVIIKGKDFEEYVNGIEEQLRESSDDFHRAVTFLDQPMSSELYDENELEEAGYPNKYHQAMFVFSSDDVSHFVSGIIVYFKTLQQEEFNTVMITEDQKVKSVNDKGHHSQVTELVITAW